MPLPPSEVPRGPLRVQPTKTVAEGRRVARGEAWLYMLTVAQLLAMCVGPTHERVLCTFARQAVFLRVTWGAGGAIWSLQSGDFRVNLNF